MDPKPRTEAQREAIARLPEDARGALVEGGFEIFEVNQASVATIMEAIRGTGFRVEWGDGLSEADRTAVGQEIMPAAEVALKRNTAGHPKIYDKLMTYEAAELVNEWGQAFSMLQPGARGIMGSVGLHLSLLYRDYNSQIPEDPIYATFNDGTDVVAAGQKMVRIRTSTPTADGKRITIELTPGKIRLVPQVSPAFDPETGRGEAAEGIISARTYLPIVPEMVAKQLAPKYEIRIPQA